MGLNGPRISRGASGLRSKRSSWDGAPRLKIKMHALAFSFPEDAASPSAASSDHRAMDRPRAPRVPTRRKSRRAIPSQLMIEPLPVTVSMAELENVQDDHASAWVVGQGNFSRSFLVSSLVLDHFSLFIAGW